jgi:hypothetical protein
MKRTVTVGLQFIKLSNDNHNDNDTFVAEQPRPDVSAVEDYYLTSQEDYRRRGQRQSTTGAVVITQFIPHMSK